MLRKFPTGFLVVIALLLLVPFMPCQAAVATSAPADACAWSAIAKDMGTQHFGVILFTESSLIVQARTDDAAEMAIGKTSPSGCVGDMSYVIEFMSGVEVVTARTAPTYSAAANTGFDPTYDAKATSEVVTVRMAPTYNENGTFLETSDFAGTIIYDATARHDAATARSAPIHDNIGTIEGTFAGAQVKNPVTRTEVAGHKVLVPAAAVNSGDEDGNRFA